jgi:hypothetical protein
MNMPGFTAEVSVYKTSNYYQAPIKANQANGLVPQGLIGPYIPGGLSLFAYSPFAWPFIPRGFVSVCVPSM